jgi:hypothetical protein
LASHTYSLPFPQYSFFAFSEKQLSEWEQKAIQYNQKGVGDQACFFCIKPGKKAEA